jgi:Tol biopolymer transport system component
VLAALPAPAHATWPGKPGNIAYQALPQDPDEAGIYTIRPDGTRNRRIVGDAGGDIAWSRSGGRIAFFRNGLELWVARSDGSRPKLVLSRVNQPGHAGDPAWSPSGDRLVFTVTDVVEADEGEGTGETNYDLYVVNRDGTGLRKLARGHDATWSSRNRIAYATGDGDVVTIRPNGRGRKIWVPQGSPVRVSDLDYSPDGLKLVYIQSTPNATETTIRTIDLRTARRTSFAADVPETHAFDVSWAPRGRRVAYLHTTRGGTGAAPPDQFWTALPNGRRKRKLFDFPGEYAVFSFAWQTR